MFVNLLFLLQFILSVESTETGISDLLSSAKNTPLIAGIQCTSRTLRISSEVDSTGTISDFANITAEDELFGNGDEFDNLANTSPPYCPEGYFCDLSGNKNTVNADNVLGLCKPCAGDSNSCPSIATPGESAEGELFFEYAFEKAVVEECKDQCGAGKNTCSLTRACPSGLFCNFENAEQGGYCEKCPPHIFLCTVVEGNLTSQGITACHSSCAVQCNSLATLRLTKQATAESTDVSSSSPFSIDDVNALVGSPQLSITGPVADCGLGLEPCEGVEGSVCFMERGRAPFLNKTLNCQAGGGIAAVIYNLEAICENIEGTYFGADTYIPAVSLTHLDGIKILNEAKAMPPESPLLVTVDVGGPDINPQDCSVGCSNEIECEGTDTCNFESGEFGVCKVTEDKEQCNDGDSFGVDHLTCSGEREYCDFKFGKRGECISCPENFDSCFFSNLNSFGADACNKVCTGGSTDKIKFAPCKFCPRGEFSLGELSDGFSTVEEDVTEPCQFCNSTEKSQCVTGAGRWDMAHPERT
jgi:hypothetical protein